MQRGSAESQRRRAAPRRSAPPDAPLKFQSIMNGQKQMQKQVGASVRPNVSPIKEEPVDSSRSPALKAKQQPQYLPRSDDELSPPMDSEPSTPPSDYDPREDTLTPPPDDLSTPSSSPPSSPSSPPPDDEFEPMSSPESDPPEDEFDDPSLPSIDSDDDRRFFPADGEADDLLPDFILESDEEVSDTDSALDPIAAAAAAEAKAVADGNNKPLLRFLKGQAVAPEEQADVMAGLIQHDLAVAAAAAAKMRRRNDADRYSRESRRSSMAQRRRSRVHNDEGVGIAKNPDSVSKTKHDMDRINPLDTALRMPGSATESSAKRPVRRATISDSSRRASAAVAPNRMLQPHATDAMSTNCASEVLATTDKPEAAAASNAAENETTTPPMSEKVERLPNSMEQSSNGIEESSNGITTAVDTAACATELMLKKRLEAQMAPDVQHVAESHASVEAVQQGDEADDGGEKIEVAKHPSYARYFKMLKVGLPLAAAKDKMMLDGFDPTIMDLQPTHLVSVQRIRYYAPPQKQTKDELQQQQKQSKKKKKLFWQGTTAVGEHTLWAERDELAQSIQLDEEEFERLFVDSPEAAAKAAAVAGSSAGSSGKKPKAVHLIEGKRAQNGGIALARIKCSFVELRERINSMQEGDLQLQQLQALREFLPTSDEAGAIRTYLQQPDGEVRLMGRAEQYMYTVLEVTNAAAKLDCLIFKQQFSNRIQELKAALNTIEAACVDVQGSARLKKVLKTILKVGNQLNDSEQRGFSVESLLKLQSAKAFDKKTSVLQYVVLLIHRNDADALLFPEDLKHASEAARLPLDSLENDKVDLVTNFAKKQSAVLKMHQQQPFDGESTLEFFSSSGKPQHQCDDVEKRCTKVHSKFSQLLSYFGESPSMKSEDFFSTLCRFMQDFTAVREAVERQHKAELRKAKLAADAAARSGKVKVPVHSRRLSKFEKRSVAAAVSPVSAESKIATGEKHTSECSARRTSRISKDRRPSLAVRQLSPVGSGGRRHSVLQTVIEDAISPADATAAIAVRRQSVKMISKTTPDKLLKRRAGGVPTSSLPVLHEQQSYSSSPIPPPPPSATVASPPPPAVESPQFRTMQQQQQTSYTPQAKSVPPPPPPPPPPRHRRPVVSS